MLDHEDLHHELVGFGFGGWFRWRTSEHPDLAVYRRYVERDGRPVAVEMYVEVNPASGVIGTDLLRSIPVGHIDATVAGLREDRPDLYASYARIPAPDLRCAARHYSTSFGQAPRSWVVDMLESQITGRDRGLLAKRLDRIRDADKRRKAEDALELLRMVLPDVHAELDGRPRVEIPALDPIEPVALEPVDPRLDVPPARPFPDEFYEQVAELYRALSLRTRAVAATIADANGVQVTQVHRWIKVARQRGHLGAGQRGKVG